MQQLIVFLLSFLSLASSLRDLTEFPGASGEAVVDAVIARLDSEFGDSSSTFWTEGDDSIFLKEVANVETEYGELLTTDNGGGIWQVTSDAFDDTQDFFLIRRNPDYAERIQEISDAFDIVWATVERDELNKPLHSLLAARLVLHVRSIDAEENCGSVPNSDDKPFYAKYWFDCYREGVGDISDFNKDVNVEEEDDDADCDIASDVVFVLDSSGSINHADPDNWDRVKAFTGNFTAGLLGTTTGGERNLNRIGIITFSYFSTIHSMLTSDRDELLSKIRTLPYDGYNTNTAEGLCSLLDMNWEEGRLRLVIVMTDGMSNSPSPICGTTLEAPVFVNSMLCPSPLYYVIAVTDNINQTELEAIATGTEFIDHLDSFENTESLSYFRRQRTYQICFKASSLICDEELSKENVIGREDRKRYQVDVEDGVTVRLCVDTGQVFLYASDTVPTPNGALNTFSFEGALQDDPKCEDLFVDPVAIETIRSKFPTDFEIKDRKRQAPTPSEGITLYISIEGIVENSSFTFEAIPGNSSLYSTSCNDYPCGTNTICTDELLGYSCSCVPGYRFASNLRDCEDIDECRRISFPCSLSAICTNTNGSYECACQIGYIGDGRNCTLYKDTNLQLVVITACSVGGGVVAMVVVLAAFITIFKSMSAGKYSKQHPRNSISSNLSDSSEIDHKHLLESGEAQNNKDSEVIIQEVEKGSSENFQMVEKDYVIVNEGSKLEEEELDDQLSNSD